MTLGTLCYNYHICWLRIWSYVFIADMKQLRPFSVYKAYAVWRLRTLTGNCDIISAWHTLRWVFALFMILNNEYAYVMLTEQFNVNWLVDANTETTHNIYRSEFVKELCDIRDDVKFCSLSNLEISEILNYVCLYWLFVWI
jgi:hypothetical protein